MAAKPVTTPIVNAPLRPGTTLGRYTIVRRIAAGGFGVVYAATAASESGPVAIKEFLPSILACRSADATGLVACANLRDQRRFDDGLAAFFNEADTLARFADPRVVRILDVFQANGTAYFAMPLEPGCTLQQAARAGRLLPSTLKGIFTEAALGLAALHDAGLLHLDVKPGNLWLRPDGTVIVLDLGASRWEDEEGRVTHMARTPGFAAPEQYKAAAASAFSPATDVYGLSAALYACLEGAPPPPSPQRSARDPSFLSRHLAATDARLLELIDAGMDLRTSARPQSMQAWLRRLSIAATVTLPASRIYRPSRQASSGLRQRA